MSHSNSGVWGHSSSIGANAYIIFAVSDDLIIQKAFLGWCAAKSIGLKPLLGSYKGKTEQSFIVNADHLGAVLNAGWLKGQESILILGACDARDRRKASLHYITKAGDDLLPKRDELGVLQSVDRKTALASDGWSYDPSTEEYFVCLDPNAIPLCPFGIAAMIDYSWEHGARDMAESKYMEPLARAYLAARRTI